MKKKKYVILMLSLVVIVAAILSIFVANPQAGRSLVTTEGTYFIVDKKGMPTVMNNQSGNGDLFDGLNNGDMIIIACPGMTRTAQYPGKTSVIMCIRIARGSLDAIPDATLSELQKMGYGFEREA